MKAFVTGAGTEIGKTFVTCGLARQLRAEGRAVRAVKPVLSGFDPVMAADSDAGQLLAACGHAVDEAGIAAIAPWRYAAPMSPDWAAEEEGRAIPYEAVLAFCRAQLAAGGVLIEGIGGVMVPLCPSRTVLDLIADVGVPVVLVAGSYLGALSHALTAWQVLRARGLSVVMVVSESTGGPAMDPDRTAATLAAHCGAAVQTLRRSAEGLHDAAGFGRIVQALDGLISTAASR